MTAAKAWAAIIAYILLQFFHIPVSPEIQLAIEVVVMGMAVYWTPNKPKSA